MIAPRASRCRPSCVRALEEEAEIQASLRVEGEAVTGAEVAAQRLRDQSAEARTSCARSPRDSSCRRVTRPTSGRGYRLRDGLRGPSLRPRPRPSAPNALGGEPLGEEQEHALRARLERLVRRREQLGPVNPLAGQEYAEAIAHVEELEERRTDLETALRELRAGDPGNRSPDTRDLQRDILGRGPQLRGACRRRVPRG